MAAQIPGILGAVQPDIFTRVRTRERVNAVSGGTRIVCVMGEGETEETLVVSATGGGQDGVNADFTGTNNPDGRHFQISKLDLVRARTSILKNGIPLTVLEENIDTDPFDTRFDVRVERLTGRVELQQARLEDFGTDEFGNTLFYLASASNVGSGRISIGLTGLVDTNAPDESWTVRCTANVKDGYGDAIPGEGTFTVTGSTSGQIFDTNGNPIVWKSDGYAVTNGILQFAIVEGAIPFEVNDRFTIQVNSGVLDSSDSLVARYIANEDLNDPENFFISGDLFNKHGNPSITNTLSLGAQMAFENGAPRVTAIQTKPPVPRKTSEFLIVQDNPLTTDVEGATGGFDVTDTIFPLGLGNQPDIDTVVNVFVVNSDGSEEQVVLNKTDFFQFSTVASAYLSFVLGPIGSTYTVFNAPQVEQDGNDGYILSESTTSIFFSSPTVAFEADRGESGEGDVGKKIEVLSPSTISGTYTIVTIGDGYGDLTQATATKDSGAITADVVTEDVIWQVIDPNETGSYFAITDDVAVNNFTVGKGMRVSYVDVRDADFFDTNWGEALESAELVEVQIMVPLPSSTISNIFQTTKVHVEEMSNIINQRERIAVIGSIDGLTPDALLGNTLAAPEDIGVLEGIQGDDPEEVLAGNIEDLANYSVPDAFGDSFRMVYLWPDRIVRNINGQNTFLDGFYMSAAVGGFLGGQTNIAQPPTFRTLAGFTILRDRVARRIIKNELAGAGVLVVEPVAGGGRMLHGLTTVQSGAPEEEEISVVGVRDQVARSLRASLRPFIGRLQSPTVISQISTGVSKLLRSLVGQGLLAGFGNISVQRNEIEPRQIDISVEINPVGPINWIFIDISVSL
jgi:hypothetical protein